MSLIKIGIKEGKEMIGAGYDQASFQLGIVKKKLEIYGVQKKIKVEMTKLGEMFYNFFQQNRKDIQNDKQIAGLVESIKEQKEEIKTAEQEIVTIKSNSKDAKEKLCSSGRSLFEKIKQGLSPGDKVIESTDAQPRPPLEQKMPGVEEGKKEVKKVKKTAKQGLNPGDKVIESTDAQPRPPLEQKMPGVEEGKEEVKKVKKTETAKERTSI